MPSFDLMDKVELFLRTGTFRADATKSSRKVTRATSKHFIYKDGCLWRSFRGRVLQVVRSEEEVRDILIRYHDNNNHAGQSRMIKDILLMYYWVGVTPEVKKYVKACAVCQDRIHNQSQCPLMKCCLAYNCEASSYVYPKLTFHRFPKDAKLRQQWLEVAQRDEGSVRTNSYLCSKHFDPCCFTPNKDGQLSLSPDAVPTIMSVETEESQECGDTDEDILNSRTLEDFLYMSDAETVGPCEPAFGQYKTPVQLQEHEYCLPAPDPYNKTVQPLRGFRRRKLIIEPSFAVYNQIARYLRNRIVPLQTRKRRNSFQRMAKRFGIIDGVLMYTRVSPPVRVPRSREEVNSILQQFHDSQGHSGHAICQREITKLYYWNNMSQDLARWISCCQTCLSRTKRTWLRCSIYSCTNCCGPVERGLGLTFHKFPLHNSALLTQWLKAVGRPNWHPRLRSSICSTHFTDDCFDWSGEKVTLRPDAVPTLSLYRDAASSSSGPPQSDVGEETPFAKFDAVELYLRKRCYLPGLSLVEKNTFRRFCRKFVIKDDELHMVKKDRVCLVLRNRQQVEVALNDYHNELNHLNVNKCLRLLHERYFWKTMKLDVVQWINKCSQCNKKNLNQTEPGGSESLLQALRSPQIHCDSDSGKDDDYSDVEEDDHDDAGEDRAVPFPTSVTMSHQDPFSTSFFNNEVTISSQTENPIIPIVKPSIQPRTLYAGVVPVKAVKPPQYEDQKKTEKQHSVQIQLLEQTQPQDLKEAGAPGTQVQAGTKPKLPQATSKPIRPPRPSSASKTQPGSQTSLQPQSSHRVQKQVKRGSDPEAGPLSKRNPSCGLEPMVAPSTKPWPVFTIGSPTLTQMPKPTPEVDSPAPVHRPRRLQARTVIQQCTQAKVKVKPAQDGFDAQWAEIQEGMVVYVCFFNGAAESVTYEMASSLMTTRLFRKDTRHTVSLLDLPGSVLFIPQDSLVGEPVPQRKMQYRGLCEPWWGAQLFSNLVSTCANLIAESVKCRTAGVKVEQGVYGQKQEIILSSVEPLTVLLEF